MRFLKHPTRVELGDKEEFIIPVKMDAGLYTLGGRLGLKLYDSKAIQDLDRQASLQLHLLEKSMPPRGIDNNGLYNEQEAHILEKMQALNLEKMMALELQKQSLKPSEVAVLSPNFGTAVLMVVRETFKSLWLCILYTFFVIAACFHACNGLWTFGISWGITLSERSRHLSRRFANIVLFTLLFLGLSSIWGSYWINLKN
jgi:succinate dehydrogenase / fumarate reductase cytochrome b subunit